MRKLYLRCFLHPREVFEQLSHTPSIRFGAAAVMVNAIVYTFVYIFLILGDGRPFKPLLDIAPEVYYRYNVFFCAPSMFAGWLLSSFAIHFVARASGGQGTWQVSLTLVGFTIGIASWATGVHDLVTSFLGAVHVIDQQHYEHLLNTPTVWRTLLWIQMGAYLIWFLALYYLTGRIGYRLPPIKSMLVGLLGFVVYQGFFLVFNR